MSGLGKTFTSVPGARNKGEFFAGLRKGQSIVSGEHGGARKLARALTHIAVELICERPWTMALAPLITALPGAALAVCLRDRAFCRHWLARARERFPQAIDLDLGARAAI
jgi:hypothetical protein